MDPGALEDELTCAVCLHVYQDPVALPCQHSFCLKCIEGVWDQTKGPGGFECPQCRRIFNPRPSLERNFTLCNTVENYNCSQPPADSARVVCDYCDDNPNPAVKTCLKCETSFCSHHLKPHLLNKTLSGHTLMEPLLDLTGTKCLDHKKVLEVYCKDDAECVCISCIITGKHKSHTLLSLGQAEAVIKEELEREVEKLRGVQQNCSSKQRDLGRSEAEIKTRINELKGKLSKSFSEWRRQLEEDEEYTLKLIDEEGLRTLSQIRNCSEALNKRMEQMTLIDGETQSLVQRDPVSFIQNWKQVLSRVTETQRVTDPDVPALTLNLSNISKLIQKRLNGWEKYHSDILGIISSTKLRAVIWGETVQRWVKANSTSQECDGISSTCRWVRFQQQSRNSTPYRTTQPLDQLPIYLFKHSLPSAPTHSGSRMYHLRDTLQQPVLLGFPTSKQPSHPLRASPGQCWLCFSLHRCCLTC
ncbi:E3 ubiquitin/ISG15 ligase TRIM25-like isoform X2 [Heterodontus francisci]|uniref:E3 ubiquitin/ISG15 ligase TRIM25-like isoform X2 n=1 Tax=Heterodontus francisci TaxID=7792 RepID=UPI00355BF9F1